jgi:hypothetical protein
VVMVVAEMMGEMTHLPLLEALVLHEEEEGAVLQLHPEHDVLPRLFPIPRRRIGWTLQVESLIHCFHCVWY